MPLKAFIILVVLLTIAVILFIEIAGMPGEIARRRKHPQAKAISLLGWIGLPIGLVPWLIAMIWSNLDPFTFTKNIDTAPDSKGGSADEQTSSS